MPDDELIEESGVQEDEEPVSDVESTVQEQETSSEPSTTVTELEEESTGNISPSEESVPDLEDSGEESSGDDETSVEETSFDSETSEDTTEETTEEETTEESFEAYMLSDDFEEFLSSSVVVDRYQYAILERLEFIQYALAIEIALLFLILFMRYKK